MTIDGSLGNDTIYLNGSKQVLDYSNAQNGTDTVYGLEADDSIIANPWKSLVYDLKYADSGMCQGTARTAAF